MADPAPAAQSAPPDVLELPPDAGLVSVAATGPDAPDGVTVPLCELFGEPDARIAPVRFCEGAAVQGSSANTAPLPRPRSTHHHIDHALLMRAVRWHTDNPWVRLYTERWLTAPFQHADGTRAGRTQGTPQGGVISPVLANLFLHYAFDTWMVRHHPDAPFARYADDAVVHCRSAAAAAQLHADLATRFAAVGLELHPTKTRIVYCQDSNRTEAHAHTSFDFLGYTFRPRLAINKDGGYFVSFAPAISGKAQTAIRQRLHDLHLARRTDLALEEIARRMNPLVRGWIAYYGRYYRSVLRQVLAHLNRLLIQWARRKYKRLRGHPRAAAHWLGAIARREPTLFAHWQLGTFGTTE